MSAYLEKIRDLDTLLALVRDHERMTKLGAHLPRAQVSTANTDVVDTKINKLSKAS